jgi:hypothetical protein
MVSSTQRLGKSDSCIGQSEKSQKKNAIKGQRIFPVKTQHASGECRANAIPEEQMPSAMRSK